MKMSQKNYCYIDFDGVFNVFTPHQNYEQLATTGHYYSQQVIEAFLHMVKNNKVTVVWVTSWEHGVHRMAELMGFTHSTEYEVLPAQEHDVDLTQWLKLDSVRTHFSQHQPAIAVWVDDEIYSYDFAIDYCDRTDGIQWLS